MTQRNENKSETLTNGAAEKASLDTIRRLLLAPEQQALTDLRERVDAAKLTADELSQILPESITKARDEGTELSRSLGPVVDEAIKESIRNDPDTLAEAISPIMMPAIRRAVMQMISGMADSFNRTLEQSLSGQGIKWRIEAFRTGRSFSEVAMLHSFVYRVEQVFLIHRETGLKLAHITNQQGDVIDADMVSGMLTAIQDFVRDSFSDGKRELLNTMDCEQHDVLIEYGSKAILAAVVSGIAPPELRSLLAVTLDNVHATHARLLEDFAGDPEPFEAAHPQLELCLEAQQKTGQRANPKQKSSMARFGWAIPVAVILGLLTWGTFWYRARQRTDTFANATAMPTSVDAKYDSGTIRLNGTAHQDWLEDLNERTARLSWLRGIDTNSVENLDEPWYRFLEQLNQQPGLTVIESKRVGNQYRLTGLRDPLASQPSTILSKSGLASDRVQMSWSPYQALDKPIVERRLENILNPPETVSLKWQDDKLVVDGTTTDTWWRNAEQRALAILGAGQLDANSLQISNPRIDAFFERLQSEPGIVVTSTEWDDGRFQITAKRDDYAVDPSTLLQETGVAPHDADFRWSTFVSDDPVIVERRLRGELSLPRSVAVSLRNGKPHLIGTADLDWIHSLQGRIEEANNIGTVDYTGIAPQGIEELVSIRKSIDETVIYFKSNSVQLAEKELRKIRELRKNVIELKRLAEHFQRTVKIQIAGRTATEKPQKALSVERCQEVIDELLLNSGIPNEMFDSTWNSDQNHGPVFQDKQRGRVTFQVVEQSS